MLVENADHWAFGGFPGLEFLGVGLDLNPLISPTTNLYGAGLLHVGVNDCILVVKMVDGVPEVGSTVMIKVGGVKVVPEVVPASRQRHAFHGFPVLLADRVAIFLNLILVPQVYFPTRQDVHHVAKSVLAALRGEDSSGASWRVCVEADWKIVFDVLDGDFISGRTAHVVLLRYTIGIGSSKGFFELDRLVLSKNARMRPRGVSRRSRDSFAHHGLIFFGQNELAGSLSKWKLLTASEYERWVWMRVLTCAVAGRFLNLKVV